MTTYDLEILIRTKKTGDDPSPPPDSGFKWTELKSKVDLAKQAFDTAAQTIKVSPRIRSSAKAINFGIMYGKGAYSLSKDIGVSITSPRRLTPRAMRCWANCATPPRAWSLTPS